MVCCRGAFIDDRLKSVCLDAGCVCQGFDTYNIQRYSVHFVESKRKRDQVMAFGVPSTYSVQTVVNDMI